MDNVSKSEGASRLAGEVLADLQAEVARSEELMFRFVVTPDADEAEVLSSIPGVRAVEMDSKVLNSSLPRGPNTEVLCLGAAQSLAGDLEAAGVERVYGCHVPIGFPSHRHYLERGIGDGVLPSLLVGRRRFTSESAIRWWIAATFASRCGITRTGVSTPGQIATLERAGILAPKEA